MRRRVWITFTAALWLGGLCVADARNNSRPRAGRSATVRKSAVQGRVIGNRRTRVYYRAGQGQSVPPGRDRVYFRTEAQARAAGYRPWRGRWKVPPSLPTSEAQSRPPASPLSRQQPSTAPTSPTANE